MKLRAHPLRAVEREKAIVFAVSELFDRHPDWVGLDVCQVDEERWVATIWMWGLRSYGRSPIDAQWRLRDTVVKFFARAARNNGRVCL